MKPVKVLYCIDNLLRGGTELQLAGLIERLDPEQYQPYLLTIRPSDPALTPPNCVHLAWYVPTLFSIAGFKALFRLIQFLRAEKISIVQTFFQDSTLFAGIAALVARVPVRVACFRDLGFWVTPKQKVALSFVYRRMTGFICNAFVVQDHFHRLFAIPVDKMQVIRNGVNTGALEYVSHTGASRNVGIVGNMTRYVKRTDLFIKAAAIVHKSRPDIRWHVIGDGHMRNELETLAVDLGLGSQIVFAGRIDDIPSYLEQLDIGVICSDSEGLSNAIIEYMFKGVATVATNVGGNSELVINGKTGLLVSPDDPQALAEAILALVNDPVKRQQIAKHARDHVFEEYSWQACLGAHDDFYTQQLRNNRQ